MPETLWFDLECDGLTPTVIHCICAQDETGRQYRWNHAQEGNFSQGLEVLAAADHLIGHNILGFDIPVLHRLHPGWTPKGKATDTLVLSRVCYPHLRELDFRRKKFPKELVASHSLKAWGARLGFTKYSYGEDEESAWSEWSREMEDYCARDVEVTYRLWQYLEDAELPEEVSDLEHLFHETMLLLTWRGVHFDRQAAQKLYVRLQAERDQCATKLQEVFPPKEVVSYTPKRKQRRVKMVPFNPGSRIQIAERLIEKGWKPVEYTADGRPKISETILDELGHVYPEAADLNRYLLVGKRISQLAEGGSSWLGTVGPDSRIHGHVISCGTYSSRCTHIKPNLAQVPSVDSEFGAECRALFQATPGYRLVGVDVASLELAVLGHYCSTWDGGRLAREVAEGDIHTRNAEAAGLTEELGGRSAAKKLIYSLCYGCGDDLLGSIVGGGRAEGKALRARFLGRTPSLRKLTAEVKRKTKTGDPLIGLDGRKLYPRSQHSALNLLIQSAGAILVKRATVLFKLVLEEMGLKFREDFAIVLHVHDEWQTEVVPEHVELVATAAQQSITQAGEVCGLKAPLKGEAKIGMTWAETH